MSSKSKSRGDYVCRVRYRNKLPAIPFGAKLVDLPALATRNVEYKTNSLIEQTPHALALDSVSVVPFDKLIVDYLDNMESHPELSRRGNSPPGQVSEEDSILMIPPREETGAGGASKRSHVTWLRRSEYIATTSSKPQQQQQVSATRDIRSSKMSRADREAHIYRTAESQIQGILKTFVPPDVSSLQHPRTKKKAKAITPVLPDWHLQHNVYTLGQFPADPADAHRLRKRQRAAESSSSHAPSQEDATDRGILRPISNPHDANDTYLIWFLPDDESTPIIKRQKTNPDDVQGKPLRYEAVRDYTYRNDPSEHINMLFTLQSNEDASNVYRYAMVKSKLIATKKRALAPMYRHLNDYEKTNVLNVTYN
ncbi:RNA polymerase II-associated [Gongronella butleri]|nr:RNA polymerase II-associated [Gongronella butleri]